MDILADVAVFLIGAAAGGWLVLWMSSEPEARR